jgi:hypothetical protein
LFKLFIGSDPPNDPLAEHKRQKKHASTSYCQRQCRVPVPIHPLLPIPQPPKTTIPGGDKNAPTLQKPASDVNDLKFEYSVLVHHLRTCWYEKIVQAYTIIIVRTGDVVHQSTTTYGVAGVECTEGFKLPNLYLEALEAFSNDLTLAAKISASALVLRVRS